MENFVLLDHEMICERGINLSYKLYLVNNSYCLSAAQGVNCSYLEDITVNASYALYIFKRVVGGRVRPCHLRDVVCDLLVMYDPDKDYSVISQKE